MADSVELPGSVTELSDILAMLSRLNSETEFASEMEVIVQLNAIHNYALLADGDNIVEDLLVEILGRDRAGRAPEPRLSFNDVELEKEKTLADYGIEPGSVLHLKCTPRVLSHTDGLGYTETAKMGYAQSGSSVRPSRDGEMKIFVQSGCYGNYALEVDSSNTIQDVLITVLPIGLVLRLYLEEPRLYFNGHLLESAKSLADCGIKEGSILHLEDKLMTTPHLPCLISRERPNVLLGRKQITITDRPLAIWEKEHDKLLLSLLVEQIPNGVGENILHGGEDSWCDIVAKFNESTGLKYEYKHLSEHFNFYKREYQIVNNIKHHPKFSWDHQRHVVIATDADWNAYLQGNHNARPYRRRAIPYFDLLKILFDDTN